MKKEKFNLGKFFKTLVIVGIFAFVPLVFVGCQTGGGGGAAKEYSISYVLNGGTNSDSNPTKIDKDMGDVWLQNPTREGYYFYGWYKDKYFNQQISKLSFDDIKGDLTLYAVWHPISYSITYELNGGEDKYGNQTSYTIEDFRGKGDIEHDILLVDPTREGYAFAGWYLNEDFSGEALLGIAQGTRGDLTLYAKWTSNTYTVKFNKNSDRASGSMSNQTFAYGVEQALSNNVFTRAGYAFAGWSTSANGSVEYDDGEEISNLIKENGGTVELFAVWKAIFTTSGGKITGLTTYGKNLTTIEIPSIIDDVKITEIGATAFNNCDKLTSISIPNSVTKIGNNAFYYCSRLTEITIPASVESIDYCAFMNCGKLTSIELPSKLTEIANGLFNGCSGLTEITISNSVTKIGDYAFYRCSSLTGVAIPSDVTSIGSYAFQNCSKLASISIPSKVATIGEKTFYECEKLATITFESGIQLTTIGKYAFAGCSGLTSIAIPSSVTSIGEYAFAGCNKLTEVAIPSKVETIEDYTFQGCSSLTSFIVPTNVTTIDEGAFRNCTSLKLVYIPESVTTISASQKSKSPFYGCEDSLIIYCGASSKPSDWSSYWNYNTTSTYLTVVWGISGDISLTSDFSYVVVGEEGEKEVWLLKYIGDATTVEIPSEIEEMPVTKLNEYCFYNSSITSVTIPNSITSIGSYAFSDCGSLTGITIPNSVTSIGSYAFRNCTNLTSVHYNANLTTALAGNSNVFYKAGTSGDGIAVTIGNDVETIPAFLFCAADSSNSPKVTSVSISSSVTSIGGAAFEYCSELTTVTFEENSKLTSIGASAFYQCSGLTEIIIPNSVTTIDRDAFGSCASLTSIVIPNSVTSIKLSAFECCSSLTTVTFEENSELTTIGSYAFQDCNKLTSISIPSSVTTIGTRTFRGCSNLTEIMIPSSVTSIENYAFYGCSGLTTVFYGGTESDWTALSKNIGSDNTSLTGATIYYFVENEEDVPAGGGNYWHYVGGVTTIWSL